MEMDPSFDALRKSGISYVAGVGCCTNPDIMFIGEAPGPMENAVGIPFSGSAGTIFKRLLRDNHLLDMDRVYVTNVIKYMPCKPNSMDFRKPTQEEIELAQPYLGKEIRLINPKLICLMGNVPIRAFFQGQNSVTKLRGKFFNEDPKVFVTNHPSLAQYDPLALNTLQKDFRKLASHVNG